MLLRVVNKSQEIFSSLSWNTSFLLGSTFGGSMIINDVRLQNSETLNAKLFGIGSARHCAFSSDMKYLAVSGNLVQLFSPKLEHSLIEQQSLNKIASINPSSQEVVSQVAWSIPNPHVFAIAVTSVINQIGCQEDPPQGYEVHIYNADSHQLLAKCPLKSRINCLLWSSKPENNSQLLLCGQQDGKIAVIKVRGNHSFTTEICCFLSFHTSPVLFL